MRAAASRIVYRPAIGIFSPPSARIILSVEIHNVAERRLVTVIEILSPVNKRGASAQEYFDRRIELIQTAARLPQRPARRACGGRPGVGACAAGNAKPGIGARVTGPIGVTLCTGVE